jgi:hypothetical protein
MPSNKTHRARTTNKHGIKRVVRGIYLEVDEEVYVQVSTIAKVEERTVPGQLRFMINQGLERYHNMRDTQ